MPSSTEFTVRMEDKPGRLAKYCQALAERGVNIIGFESFPQQGQSVVRFVVDNPGTAKTVLDEQHAKYEQSEVAFAKFAHRPGELARAAARLGENNINIDYAYGGVESGTNAPIVIFGVKDVSRAATLLDAVASKAA